MSLTPSGRRRYVQGQRFTSTPTGVGGDDVMQESYYTGGDDPQAPSEPPFDFDGLQNNLNDQDSSVVQDDSSGFGDEIEPSSEAQHLDVDQQSGASGDQDVGNLRDYVIDKLKNLGIPERKLTGKDAIDKVFHWDFDLDSGNASGHYMIPSYTPEQNIDINEAQKIAREIGDLFDLSQKISTEGRNFKVTFQTKTDDTGQEAQTGTSFDDLWSSGDERGEGQSKAASSRYPHIRGAQDRVLQDLYNRMKYGVDNG